MSPTRISDSGDNMGVLNLHDLKIADYMRVEAQLSLTQKSALAMHLAAAVHPSDDAADPSNEIEDLLRLIIWNAEPDLIESVARVAARNPNTPHGLAWALANDDEGAALPILGASGALSDADLMAIVADTASFAKMGAIACRASVSEDLSRSLAVHGDENTVLLLLKNLAADVPDDAFGCILDRHGRNASIQEGMIDREAITSSTRTRLLGMLDPDLASKLAARHPEPTATADPKSDRAPASPGYPTQLTPDDLRDLISQMTKERSITATFLVRKLCFADFDVFCAALSAAAEAPEGALRVALLDAPSVHLPAFWQKASLAMDWLPVGCAALLALIFIDRNYNKSDPEIFQKNIIDRTIANLKTDNHILSDPQKKFFRSL